MSVQVTFDNYMFEMYQLFSLAYFVFTIVVAPSSLRYSGVTANSVTFQWNSLTVDGVEVNWYVIICTTGNFSFMVSYVFLK